MVKVIGVKISDEIFVKIITEINRLGLTKSQFLRMVLENYFNNQKSVENIKVNLLNSEVNRKIDNDEYQTTRNDVDAFIKRLNEDLKKK